MKSYKIIFNDNTEQTIECDQMRPATDFTAFVNFNPKDSEYKNDIVACIPNENYKVVMDISQKKV